MSSRRAWVLGFKQTPKLDGAMIGKRVIGGMITKTLPKLATAERLA